MTAADQATRPPNKPEPKPAPTGPKPPAPPSDDMFALAESLGFPAPARRDPFTAAVGVCAIATPGGPVPNVPGANSCPSGLQDGRVVGARGAATFALPAIPTVPSFDNGPGWAS